jgi:Protein of unknown function (DUF998)
MSVTAASTARAADQLPQPGSVMAGNITRSLLGYLALAGPFYVVLSLVQALTRNGFSLAHDEWSLLAVGHLGWIQTVNLILTGAMTVTGAVGFRRAVGRSATAGRWAPRLLAGYGIALIAAGIFRADAADGFPPGTPAGRPAHVSWHGPLHLLSGSIGFACLIAACFVVARMYARRGNRRAAVASRVIGAAFTVAFAGIASGAGHAAVNLAFTAAVIASSAWLTAVAVDLYRRTRHDEQAAEVAR